MCFCASVCVEKLGDQVVGICLSGASEPLASVLFALQPLPSQPLFYK